MLDWLSLNPDLVHDPERMAEIAPEAALLADHMRESLHLLDRLWGVAPETRTSTPYGHAELEADLVAAQAEADDLRTDLGRAAKRISDLEARLAEADDPGLDDAAYKRVGLHPGAHRVVVDAARRALLAHWHPDRYAAGQCEYATRQFQEVANAFDVILATRAG